MEQVFSAFPNTTSLFSKVNEYLNIQAESAKLDVAEKTAGLFSKILFSFFFMLLFGIFLIFFGTAFACLIAEYTGKYYIGFVIVALLFLLLITILWFLKNRFLKLMILNSLLDQINYESSDK